MNEESPGLVDKGEPYPRGIGAAHKSDRSRSNDKVNVSFECVLSLRGHRVEMFLRVMDRMKVPEPRDFVTQVM